MIIVIALCLNGSISVFFLFLFGFHVEIFRLFSTAFIMEFGQHVLYVKPINKKASTFPNHLQGKVPGQAKRSERAQIQSDSPLFS